MINTELYLAIMSRLMDQKETPLLHFDLYTDQLETEKQGRGEVFKMPAGFIRFNPVQWMDIGEGRKQGTQEFFIVVADKNLNYSSSKVTERMRDKALQSFTLLDYVQRMLDHWQPEGIGAGTIQLVSTDPVQTFHGVTSHVITCKCRLVNDVNLKTYVVPDPKPGLSVSVEKL